MRRPRGRRGLGGLLVGVVSAACLSGCGIPTQATARPIAASEAPVAPQTTPTTLSGYVNVTVYFISTNFFAAPRTRFVAPPASLTAVINVLLKGPTPTTLKTVGIETALDSSVKLLSSHVASGVATVNFNAAFGEISGSQEVLAVAQVVYTVAARLGTAIGVLFEIAGFPAEVPIGTGGVVTGPVRVSDYASHAPPTTTTTTTVP